MRLKLGQLQQVVKRTINEEKASDALRAEIKRVLGPSVITEGRLETVVAAANDCMDVMDRTGKSGRLAFKSSVTASWLDHNHPEVRAFAARVCPEKFLPKMAYDTSSQVRKQVATRSSLQVVREMMRRFPSDDQLRSVYRTRRIDEASGLPTPKVEPMGHDPVDGAERMGDVSRTNPGEDLTENWYNQQAQRMMHMYGRNIEGNWEEIAVRRLASSMKATNGFELDEAKLMKSIKELMKDKDDRAMERDALKETMAWLAGQDQAESLREGALPNITEEVDPVQELVEGNLTSEQYVQQASKLFRVQEATLPLSIRKYRIGEGNARQTLVPCIGMLPHRHGFRALDERALDSFCENWTRRQAINGEPLRLEWTNHPSDMNKIGFTVLLK